MGAGDGFLQIGEAVAIWICWWINAPDIVNPFPNIAHAVAVQVNLLAMDSAHPECKENQANRSRTTAMAPFPAIKATAWHNIFI
jgi:hypothetical protein